MMARGARGRAMSLIMSANICHDTATSAVWRVTDIAIHQRQRMRNERLSVMPGSASWECWLNRGDGPGSVPHG
jgi:hypothetical protein